MKNKKIDSKNVESIYNLTPMQERLLVHWLSESSENEYFEQLCIKFSGNIDKTKFEKSWISTVNNNEMLRSCFRWKGVKQPYQIVLKNKQPEISYHQISDNIENELSKIKKIDIKKGFDFEESLFRVTLCETNENTFYLIVSFHHIILDGWSLGIILKEFFVNYFSIEHDYKYEILNKSKFGLFSKFLNKRDNKEDLKFWSSYLNGYTPTKLNNLSNKLIQHNEKGHIEVNVEPKLMKKITRLQNDKKISFSSIILSAWGILLHKYTNSNDVIFGTTFSGRSTSEIDNIENAVGLYMNSLPVRINVNRENGLLSELLQDVSDDVINCQKSEYVTLNDIVKELGGKRVTDLYNSIVIIDNYPLDRILTSTKFDFEMLSYDMFENVDIDIALSVRQFDELSICLTYNQKVIDSDRADNMVTHYIQILQSIIKNIDRNIQDVTLISVEEKNRILLNAKGPGANIEGQEFIDQRIRKNAEKNSNKTAIEIGKISTNYEELINRSDQIAQMLITNDIEPGSVIGIMQNRSMDMIASILAIFKCGCMYLPIDPKFPKNRIVHMLSDSDANALITDELNMDILSESIEIKETKVILLNKKEQATDFSTVSKSFKFKRKHNDPAYIIYTSGSSGKPKGVIISHKNLINFVLGMDRAIPFDGCNNILCSTTISFDIFVLEALFGLWKNLSVVLTKDSENLNPIDICKIVQDKTVDVVQFTPSRLKQILQNKDWEQYFKNLKLLIVGGEPFPVEHLSELQHKTSCRLFNVYGPTETTVWSSVKELSHEKTVSIGAPILNTDFYIVNEETLELQPDGLPGELCIGGEGVAIGYHNKPSLNKEKFVKCQYDNDKKMYRTGDYARYINGEFEILGRIDNQAKLRGFRIELEEIESEIKKNQDVIDCVVIVKKMSEWTNALCAFYKSDTPIDSEKMRSVLSQELPDYMVPALYHKIDKIPQTPNGKVDRKSLEDIDIQEEKSAAAPAETMTKTQRGVHDIWVQIIGRNKIKLDEKFFESGGDSVNILQICSSLSSHFKKDISVSDIFKYPTIRKLSSYISCEISDVKEDSSSLKTSVNEKAKSKKVGDCDEVAIIGMSSRMPGSNDYLTFWDNIRDGVNSVQKISDEQLKNEGVSEHLIADDRYIKYKGLLDDSDCFDYGFFGYNSREANIIDPQIRLFHEATWNCLEDAGYNPYDYSKRIGLFAGSSNNIQWVASRIKGYHGDSENFEIHNLNSQSFSTMISYKLNLSGPSLTINTACSTSLVAIHLAINALKRNECEIALAGAVCLTYPIMSGLLYEEGLFVSPSGECRSFDNSANGVVGGNGVGIVALKPLSAAIKDGDHIHAVIKGSAVNNDASNKAGYAAPSTIGQSEVIKSAMQDANIEPEMISYVEGHGSGTSLGDMVEIDALQIAFNGAPKKSCSVGSVKSNIGHLDTAAGMAGLIKTVMSIKNKQIPPVVHFGNPNQRLKLDNSAFYVHNELTKWSPKGDKKLIAGVSSFGIGGTNAHVILEESPKLAENNTRRSVNLFSVSAKDEEVLDLMSKKLEQFLTNNNQLNSGDVAYTLHTGRNTFEFKKVFVYDSATNELESLFTSTNQRIVKTFKSNTGTMSTVFMFGGIGSQFKNMCRGLYKDEPLFKKEMDRCFEIVKNEYGYNLETELFPEENISDDFESSSKGQLALFAIQYSMARLLISIGVKPRAMIGYSFGEYVAACIAGVFSLSDALKMILERSHLMDIVKDGGMLSVPLNSEKVTSLLIEGVELSIDNGNSCVVSGKMLDLNKFEKILNEKKLFCQYLNTTIPAHSGLMKEVEQEYARFLEEINFKDAQIPIISNTSGTWANESIGSKDYWIKHLIKPVEFSKGIQTLLDSNTTFIEIGSGRELTPLIFDRLKQKDAQYAISMVRPRNNNQIDDVSYYLNQIGRLWLLGCQINWSSFYKDFRYQKVALPGYPFKRIKLDSKIKLMNGFQMSNNNLGSNQESVANNDLKKQPTSFDMWDDSVDTEYIAGETQIEVALIEIWKKFLNCEEIGITDNFFDVGGNSLKAISVLAEIEKSFGCKIPIKEFMSKPYIGEIAKHLDSIQENKKPTIRRIERRLKYSVSSQQRQMFIISKLSKPNVAYNMSYLLDLGKKVEDDRLESALHFLARKHVNLRTTFEMSSSEPVQIIHEKEIVSFTKERVFANENVEEFSKTLIRPYDISKLPLWRVSLITNGQGDNWLFIDVHHIISDGHSLSQMIQELVDIYEQKEKLLDVKYDCTDYAEYQKEYKETSDYKKQELFWKKTFENWQTNEELPTEFPRPKAVNFEGDRVKLHINNDKKLKILEIMRQADVTMFSFFLSVLYVFLAKQTQCKNSTIGFPVLGRRNSDLLDIMGVFINILPLQVQIDYKKSFKYLMRHVQKMMLDVLDNQDVPFERLIELSNEEQNVGRNPLFDVFLNVHDEVRNAPFCCRKNVEISELFSPISKYDLSLEVFNRKEGIECWIEYSSTIFSPKMIDLFVLRFNEILDQICENIDLDVEEISIMSTEEKHLITTTFNDTLSLSNEKMTIPKVFNKTLNKKFKEIGLVYDGQNYTYEEINSNATNIAYSLIENGVKKNDFVGIMVDRSAEMIFGLMGILKTGAAYMPMDSSYPMGRLEKMMNRCNTKCIISQLKYKEMFSDNQNVLFIEDIINENFENHTELKELEDGEALAYVIFTSGSTGEPKGVEIKHRSVINFMNGMKNSLPLSNNDVILCLTSMSFDIFVLESIVSLLLGIKVVVVGKEESKNPKAIADMIIDEKVTVIQATPSGMKMLLASKNENFLRNVNLLLIGGEAFPSNLMMDIRAYTDARIFNMYGPTETTIWSSCKELDLSTHITVGKPIDNTEIWILNEKGEQLPIGHQGLLYISGEGLAKGYHKNPEETEKRFTYNKSIGKRIYCTGDIARWLPNGDVDFLGRVDSQVKILGHRIELREIERALLNIEEIQDCAVSTVMDNNVKSLVAYYMSPSELDKTYMVNKLSLSIPKYMIPSYFMRINSLPKTLNNKIDYKKLPGIEYLKNDQQEEKKLVSDSKIESDIIDMWNQVLSSRVNGVDENFFHIGGDSLRIVALHEMFEDRFPDIVKITDLFDLPTIRLQSEFVELNNKQSKTAEQDIQTIILAKDVLRKTSGQTRTTENKRIVSSSDIEKISFSDYTIDDFVLVSFALSLMQFSVKEDITIYDYREDGFFHAKSIDLNNHETLESLLDSVIETECVKSSIDEMVNLNKFKYKSGNFVGVFLRGDKNLSISSRNELAVFVEKNGEDYVVKLRYDSGLIGSNGADNILDLLMEYLYESIMQIKIKNEA